MTGNAGWEREVADDARRYQELHEHLSRQSITESAPDGAISVTVSASGTLTSLVVADAPELAKEIMGLLARAQARIPDLLARSMVDIVGTQDPGAHLIVADARSRFPAPAREDDPPPAAEPGSDWESRPVMEDV